MNTSGATLVECVIYLGVSALLSFVLFTWWVATHEQLHRIETMTGIVLQEHLLFALLSKDVAQASADSSTWTVTDTSIACKGPQGTIAYVFKKGVLKKKGHFCHGRRTKSTVARHLDAVQWQVSQTHNKVNHLMVTLAFVGGSSKEWRFAVAAGGI